MSVIMVNQVEICCDKDGNLVPQKVAIDLAFNFLSDDGSLTMKSIPETIKDGLEVNQGLVDTCGSYDKDLSFIINESLRLCNGILWTN